VSQWPPVIKQDVQDEIDRLRALPLVLDGDSRVRDVASTMLTAGTHSGVTFTRSGNQINVTVTGGTGGPVTPNDLFPPGSAENPHSSAAAVRNNDLPANWWRTPTDPPNAIDGDWIFLPNASTGGSNLTASLYVQHFDETNGTGTSNWRAALNAGSLVRDTTRDAGGGATPGSLKWTVTAANVNSRVEHGPGSVTVPASTTRTVTAQFYNGDTVAREFRILVVQFDGNANYIDVSSGHVSPPFSVAAGAWGAATLTLTTTPQTASLRVQGQCDAAALNATMNIDAVKVD